MPETLVSIGQKAFYGCSNLLNVNFEDLTNLTTLGTYVFHNCSKLQGDVSLPSLTSIGQGAFRSCSKLETVSNLGNITQLSGDSYNGTFDGCTSLKSVVLPETITTIGRRSFYGCTSLKTLICKATTPPTISNTDAFQNVTFNIIYVPLESVDAYKSATIWTNYASKIQAIPEE